MIRIGDFSRLGQVSIKTLRYYDEVGLLKPLSVDRFTGYRYYSANQLVRLNRIILLKDLGFSLEQIAQVLCEGVSPEQLYAMLQRKHTELQQHIVEEQARLARIEAQLVTSMMEDTMPNYDVILKPVGSQLVASVRATLPNYPAVGRLFDEIYSYLALFGISGHDAIGVAVWHDHEYKTTDIDGEAVVYLKQAITGNERVKVYELPAATMVSVIHKGAYQTLSQGYEAIGRWIAANPYTIVGPTREVYLESSQPIRQDDESYVTEIQFPVLSKGKE